MLRLPSLTALALSFVVATAQAQKSPTVECKKGKEAGSCAKIVEDQKKKEDSLGLTVSVGFHGDRTNRESVKDSEAFTSRVSDLSLGFGIDRGTYPEELRVKAKTKFRSDNGETTEDVSSALFQYDYHPRHDLQLFTFAERFTDNFLAIDQRWEVGGGVSYEWNLEDKKKGTRTVVSGKKGLHELFHPIEANLECKRPPRKKGGNPRERRWYALTREGYLALEAWAANYQEQINLCARDAAAKKAVCDACNANPSDPAAPASSLKELRKDKKAELAKLPTPPRGCKAPPPPCRCGESKTRTGKALAEWVERLDDSIKSSTDAMATYREEFCGRHARSLEKRHSRLQPALSVALLFESEKATLKECENAFRAIDGNGGESTQPALELSDCGAEGEEDLQELSLDATQRVRLSVRPSLRIRPSDRISLLARYYWKPALDSPAKSNGTRDVREDFRFEIELKASDKISLSWTADWHSDDVPPSGEFDLDETTRQRLRAFRKHWVYDMAVKVGL